MGPNLVGANCPHCGGAMQLTGMQDVVQCSYCGKSSFIHRPGRPDPPVQPPQMHFGHIYLQHDPTAHTRALDGAAKTMKWVFVLTGLGVLVPAIIAAVATTSVKNSFKFPVPQATPADDDDDDASKSKSSKKGSAKSKEPVDDRPQLKATDLKRVELASVIEQGMAVAKRNDARFEMTSAFANKVRAGRVDLTGDSRVFLTFELFALDPNRPPGQNQVSKKLTVIIEKGDRFDVRETSGPSQAPRFTLPLPTCDSDRMWATAVSSGVAGDSVATVHLLPDRNPRTRSSTTAWSLRVDGYDHFRREIDASNCAMLKDWSKR